MLDKRIIQAVLCVSLCVVSPFAQAAEQDKQAVVIFNNTRIYPFEFEMNETLRAQKQKEMDAETFRRYEFTYRMDLLAKQIHQHIINRILAENRYELTVEEYEAYVKYFRNMRKNPYAKIDEAKKIEIKSEILAWHFDSIIYNKYGGKVIKTATGTYKPVEAYKTLVDELMNDHVLTIADITHRGALTELYSYFQGRNENYVDEELARSYFHRPFWGNFGVKDTQKTTKEKFKDFRENKKLRVR
ncbi:MAG: hypothetical protein AB7S78_02820 [Candidatus Omnitrophota bacterium]